MRILLHDFSGHPFQAELARALADRGHEVLHVHCESYATGKGIVAGDESARSVRYEAIPIAGGFARYSFGRRLLQELNYGARFVAIARRVRPDVIVSCNDPLFAKAVFGTWARVRKQPWAFWLQDLYSLGMSRQLALRGAPGRMLGTGFQGLERWLLQGADAVVPITDDFHPILDSWGVRRDARTVIENWAPLGEMPLRPRDNPWRAAHGLGDRFTFLYSGTLGLKHDPDLLYQLAEVVTDAEVVVVSEGLGAARLEARQRARHLPNLRILPFQPYENYPDVLGSADVLVVLLEESAGTFSVPSKVLSYLCAGRPILGAIPPENLAARTIAKAGAGIVVRPSAAAAFLAAADSLQKDDQYRQKLGRQGRRYAELTFDVDVIAERFDRILTQAAGARSPSEGRLL